MESYIKVGNTEISYSKKELLGNCAYGQVFRGFFTGESVAVKRIELKVSEKEDREVNLQIGLDHSNVLAILNVTEDDNFR